MKKRVFILVSVLLVIIMAFAACAASDGPSAVATKFFEAAKNSDIDTMVGCFEPDTAAFVKGIFDMMGDEAINGGDLLGMSGIDASSLTYKVVKEQVDGDTGTVTMEMTATVDGETKTETTDIPCAKVDGKWYVALDLGM